MHVGSMDNPTYDEGINIMMITNHIDDAQNPSYSETGPNPATQSTHQGLTESTKVSDHPYESIENGGALNQKDNNRMSGENTSEATVNDVPPNADRDYDDTCYSTQGPTDSS